MNPQAFIDSVAGLAQEAAAVTGFWPSVVIAQWADETAWGSSSAWVNGNNPAGVSPNGVIASYPDLATGVAAYVQTANLAYYDFVRMGRSAGAVAQALALGRSPWAGGQYRLPGGPPGSALAAIIQEFNLTQYDGAPPAPAPAPAPAPIPQPQPEANMIASTPSGNGYWILHSDGSVWSYGDAQYCGGLNPGAPVAGGQLPAGEVAISIEGHPGGEGYWILSSAHQVYAFGAAQYHGAPAA